MTLETVFLRDLVVEDEVSFRHVGLYADLKQVLLDDEFAFRIAEPGSWGRALFLNLTFWSAAEPSDVLVDKTIPADVIAHTAWHHLARAFLGATGPAASADAMFFGESIASAFDLYLVGRLLGNAPDSPFLESKIPQLAEHAQDAGLSEAAFEDMLHAIAAAPEQAFEDLRALLFDAGTALVGATSVDDAATRLARFADHRFASLLHHFELSNWILYARAYAPGALAPDAHVRELDRLLRAAPSSLEWLEREWVRRAP